MDNLDRLALRRARMEHAPALLRGGFRPFFLGSASWAIVSIVLWLGFLFDFGPVLSSDPLAWHRHEMLFGFVGAAIAGFSLTAVPNWTGRLPIAGSPLLLLFVMWLAGRILPLLAFVPEAITAWVDGGFYLILATLLAREIRLSSNRNWPVALAIGAFGVAATLDKAGTLGWIADRDFGVRAALALAAILIALIGGRIVPSFTRNWLAKNDAGGPMPTQPGRFDKALLLATLAVLLSYAAGNQSAALGWSLVCIGVLHFLRLLRWRGWRCIGDALVLILHVGYAWLSVALVILGLTFLRAAPASAAAHALGAGAMATMILAVMTRASLGHTGRELRTDVYTKTAYLSITVAAAARLMAAFAIGDVRIWWAVAGTAWVAAFGAFVLGYGPKLMSARA